MADMNKILTNVRQNLTNPEKSMARENIGAVEYAPNDGFYVNRGGTWVKVYDLTSVPIEGFPVDNADEYQKLSIFNGWLHPYVAIGVEGTATVGLFNYDTMQYDKEITVTDGMTTTMVSVGGNYEIHAKGASGVVTVVVSADSFDEGGSSDV